MRAKKEGRKAFRLGLAARVALIGCGAAIAATIAQWVMTPILAQKTFENARLTYAASAAQQLAMIAESPIAHGDLAQLSSLVAMMSGPLPGGEAAVLDASGRIVAATPGAASVLQTIGPSTLRSDGAIMVRGPNRIGVYPIVIDHRKVGAAMIAFRPRTILATWLGVIWRNALVLALALSVIAPFLLPLARRALSPVTTLEKSIRKRSASDKSKLADAADDRLLKPLLAAIDEVQERSEAATRRAMRMAFADPVTRLPNRLRFTPSWKI
jgi:hypothetical protein